MAYPPGSSTYIDPSHDVHDDASSATMHEAYSEKSDPSSDTALEEAVAYPSKYGRAFSRSSTSLLGRIRQSQLYWRIRHAVDTRNYSATAKLRFFVSTSIILVILSLVLLWSMFGPDRRQLHSMTHSGPRKAIIAASWTDVKDPEWIESFPQDWEIYRYVMNDPHARYHPPINYAREPMAYLTYIIDHYDSLPDYAVFIHGHNWSWHQPEPMMWKLESLNLTALDQDGYISLHCLHQPTCNVDHPKLDLRRDFLKTDRAGLLLPWFWKYVNMPGPVPDQFSWPSGAQFAVSKAAIRARTRDFWIQYRKPMLEPAAFMNHEFGAGYYWGLIHERMWHVVFGKPSVYCPDQRYCTEVQWSNGVLCDRYPVPPLGYEGIMSLSEATKGTTCFRNTNGTKDWPLRPFSLCNITEYLALPDNRCPWDEWATP